MCVFLCLRFVYYLHVLINALLSFKACQKKTEKTRQLSRPIVRPAGQPRNSCASPTVAAAAAICLFETQKAKIYTNIGIQTYIHAYITLLYAGIYVYVCTQVNYMWRGGLTVFEKIVVSMPNNNWPQFCDLAARDNRI